MATRRLTTRRLVLRAADPADAPALAEGLADWAVTRWLTGAPHPYTLADAQAFVARNAGRRGVWVITGPDGPMGVISLSPGTGLGYWLSRAHWGHGFMTEAVQAVIDARMSETDLPLLSGHHPGNGASRAILMGQGFRDVDLIDVAGVRGPQTIQRMQLTADRWRFVRAPKIDTARLRLSPLVADDAPALAVIGGDLAVSGMLAAIPHPFTVTDARVWIGDNRWRGVPKLKWGIRERADNRLVGAILINKIHMTGQKADGAPPDFAYWLDRSVWGKGYATEAGRAFLADLMPRLGLDELAADAFEENTGSHAVLTKLGFEATGTAMGTSAARVEPGPVVTYRKRIRTDAPGTGDRTAEGGARSKGTKS